MGEKPRAARSGDSAVSRKPSKLGPASCRGLGGVRVKGLGFWILGFWVFFLNVPFSGLAESRKSGAPAGRYRAAQSKQHWFRVEGFGGFGF